MSLIPVRGDRPAIVPWQGGRVFVSVHDAEHLRQRAAWKKALAEAHPDAGGTTLRFDRVRRQRERWEAAEREWYAQYGLVPPPVGEKPPTRSEVLAAWPRAWGRTRRLLELLADGAPHLLSECRAAAGRYAGQAAYDLRQHGFDVVLELPVQTGLSGRSYRLRRVA